jgi:hypothetical protein
MDFPADDADDRGWITALIIRAHPRNPWFPFSAVRFREFRGYPIRDHSRRFAGNLAPSAFRVFRVFRGKQSAIRAHPNHPW